MDWRYEIKYALSGLEGADLSAWIRTHPAVFGRAYPDRIVNNIYLDTMDFAACRDNLAGISHRSKTRIRWYGPPAKIQDPVIEQKIKVNTLGTKRRYEVEPLVELDALMQYVYEEVPDSAVLEPVLQNSYHRSYYLSMDGNYRLTVDRGISYNRVQNSLLAPELPIRDKRIIIEIKFEAAYIKSWKMISRYIPFRQTKHSKYTTGVLACYTYR